MEDPDQVAEISPSLDRRDLLAIERTKLASERTLLAWIRTGLTGVGIGLAIQKLLFFPNQEKRFIVKLIGQSLIIWGIAVFIVAFISYTYSFQRIGIKGSQKGSLIGVSILVAVLIVLSLILFWVME
jgi:putative membrane protein